MLKKNEFEVLTALMSGQVCTQRALAKVTGCSLGAVNKLCRDLRDRNMLEGFCVTENGYAALMPYKVDNAIIMAAGLSSRCSSISYEKPKGLFCVRGEILIERQIRQLQQAGITDITVVVGYKQELFFYLEEKLGVSLVVNSEYATRNNQASLMVVRNRLRNTFVCSSDNYFTENPFEPYVWKAYYATQYHEGPTEEWCMRFGSNNRITSIEIGGRDAFIMLGHAYFDRRFSNAFIDILEKEYNLPATADKPWEQLYRDHIANLDMVAREYPANTVLEFDSLDELREFDSHFLENIDSEVSNNIECALGCTCEEVRNLSPLEQGLTNLSCRFCVGGTDYVYRYSGNETEVSIDRHTERDAQVIAQKLDLDRTFIYEDPEKGWKLSYFIAHARGLNPRDSKDLRCAMEMVRKLHTSGARVASRFAFYEESKRYENLIKREQDIDIPDFDKTAEKIDELHAEFVRDNAVECLCHNDLFSQNFLIGPDGTFNLIDWEYAGMADSSQDFGAFVVRCKLSDTEAESALPDYLGHRPSDEERCHHFASVSFAGWCWYLWSLYKEMQGQFVGEWLYTYYRYAKRFSTKALKLYKQDSFTREKHIKKRLKKCC